MGKTVLVGFSGGVDSAMAALLLRERGHAVHGAMMSVRDAEGRGCGADGDREAAETLARTLGISLAVFDCSAAYGREVLGRFRDEYLAGRTPNPCVLCNPLVKFAALPAMAREAGIAFDCFATGHYARIARRGGESVLLRGIDPGKDQSYFLYRLTREQLAGTLFPLGDWTKADVRREAERRGVPAFDKPDSQDFYAGDYAELLGAEDSAGEIVDVRGNVLGTHRGYWRFTPGQRKGLGVAHSEPLYVLRLEPEANRVVAGTREEELSSGCRADRLAFFRRRPEAGERLLGKVRSAQPLRDMIVTETPGGGDGGDGVMRVDFAQPVQGVAPGQSIVLYEQGGDAVLGGGVIREAIR